ncbi:MAG: AIR synthase family protein [Lachnospiraceae bacterium]|nr:AIR synthase family protein [Lachnospiraceae bacterium]MBR6469140.1 AIR synthase family protein [Lachnospiraceae bacterium]MBR6485289.1 AIR synthase family protein [Lachnospiraceae bacterium]
MKTGKVPESVLKRSIIKQIKTKRPEILQGAAVGEDCAVIGLADDEVYVMSTDPITGTSHEVGSLAVHVTANDIASAGAEVIGVMLSVLLPEGTEEDELKTIMKQVEDTCHELNIQTIGGHTEVTRVVNQPVITVTGIGKVKKDAYVTTGGAKPGDDVVVTKWIGLEGTSIIAREKEAELVKRFSRSFIEGAADLNRYLSVVPEAAIAVSHGVSAMHDVTEGGIYGALWEVAEASGTGLEINLKDIPIRQETVEICEVFDINPYELISSGSMLITTGGGHDLVRKLKEAGISASVIGKVTKGNDRVLINGDTRRFLTPPGPDELYKVV